MENVICCFKRAVTNKNVSNIYERVMLYNLIITLCQQHEAFTTLHELIREVQLKLKLN
jgi:hypothetical protein